MQTADRWDEAVEALMRLAPPERTEHAASIRFALRFERESTPTEAVQRLASEILAKMEPHVWLTRQQLMDSVRGQTVRKSKALAFLRERAMVAYDGGSTHMYRKESDQ